MWGHRAWLSGTNLALHQMKKALTAVFLLVRGLFELVGDTGFEPVTSSVSGQNLCLGMAASVASVACARSPMSARVRVGWPTVWPTGNRLPLSES